MCDRPLLAQMQRPRHPINLQQHTVTLQGAPAALESESWSFPQS